MRSLWLALRSGQGRGGVGVNPIPSAVWERIRAFVDAHRVGQLILNISSEGVESLTITERIKVRPDERRQEPIRVRDLTGPEDGV